MPPSGESCGAAALDPHPPSCLVGLPAVLLGDEGAEVGSNRIRRRAHVELRGGWHPQNEGIVRVAGALEGGARGGVVECRLGGSPRSVASRTCADGYFRVLSWRLNEEEKKLSLEMRRTWSNFAKFGTPTLPGLDYFF